MKPKKMGQIILTEICLEYDVTEAEISGYTLIAFQEARNMAAYFLCTISGMTYLAAGERLKMSEYNVRHALAYVRERVRSGTQFAMKLDRIKRIINNSYSNINSKHNEQQHARPHSYAKGNSRR